MNTTEFQFLLVRLNPALWATPSIVFAGISVFRFDLFHKAWWIFVGLQILLIILIRAKFILNQKNRRQGYFDVPQPSSASYLLKLGLLPLSLMLFITISSSALLVILLRWGTVTLYGWWFGMALLGFWIFAFRVASAFSTMYVVEDKGVRIYFGVDRVYIPFSKINDLQYSEVVTMGLDRIIYAGHVYVPGTRNRKFIILRLKLDDLITARWFPEIYITPTNSLELLKVIQEKMEVGSGSTHIS